MRFPTKDEIPTCLIAAVFAWGLVTNCNSAPSTCDQFNEIDIKALFAYPELREEYTELKYISFQCEPGGHYDNGN